MVSTPDQDRFTDNEMHALLRHVITLIHDGALPDESQKRIEEAVRGRPAARPIQPPEQP